MCLYFPICSPVIALRNCSAWPTGPLAQVHASPAGVSHTNVREPPMVAVVSPGHWNMGVCSMTHSHSIQQETGVQGSELLQEMMLGK